MKRKRKSIAELARSCILLCALLTTVMSAGGQTVYGAVKGSGTKEDPAAGSPELKNGDTIAPGAWFWKLSGVNGKELTFQAVFEARRYQLLFHANGGRFPGSGETKTVNVRYNDGSGAAADTIALPENPVRDGYLFCGWYLKGNDAAGSTLLTEKSRYMIALEDGEDRKKAEVQEEKAVARALWRKASVTEPDDGNGPDIPPDGKDPDDSWSESHSRNHVIEKRQEAPDRTTYRRLYGKTAWQYGRILFDAKTSEAASYRWYVNGKEQSGTGETFLLSDIKRSLDGAEVRCEVLLTDGKTKLTHKTRITVYHLPEITETGFSFRAV
ncbi:MAG: InlB B-repeat-containing protein [Eubacteriales bacterium]|nr:InlB B-repeat-containing protein [Eubacteriales bacterium]